MIQPDKGLMIESYANNTFDLKTLEAVLNDIKQNSFRHLYEVQLALTGFKRFDLKMNDLTLQNLVNNTLRYYPRKYVAYINDNFISDKNRLEYKRSPFYNKEITMFDVANNPKIFSNIFMVFVDGKFMDTIQIFCKEDVTYLIFDLNDGKNTTGIPKEYFDQLREKNADITVFFLPNCSYGIYNTNHNVLKKYVDNLALKRFQLAKNLDSSEKYVTFINTNDLLFESVITDTENSADMLRFTDNSIRTFENKLVHLNIFGFRHLLDQIDISAGEKYFQVPVQDMPVPAETVLIFKNVDGKKIFAHNISLKLYYPNIYEIIGNENNDPLTIYVFYSDDTETVSLKYSNELSLYYAYITNIFEKYKDNTIPEIIKNYQPEEFIYDIKDYQNSEYYADHLRYKIETLKKWVNKDSSLLKTYLYAQMGESGAYYLDVSKIDLQSRIRHNTFDEAIYPDQREVFDEPRYVFIFRNEFSDDLREMRFFIDGKSYTPDKAIKGKNYDYYYIPTELVKEDSLVEIEKYEQFFYEQDVTFTSMKDEKSFIIENNNDVEVHANDIFLVEAVSKRYVEREYYQLSAYINDEKVTIDSNSFTLISKFFIKLKNPSLLNVPLKIYVKKRCYTKVWDITTQEEAIGYLKFTLEANNNPDYFRIFRNGCLLPNNLYNIDFGEYMNEPFTVAINIKKLIGDQYIVDCTPNKYKQIHYQQTIPDNGFLDLKGIIDKPFDLKWYDVYLNGIKLTKRNFEILSPTKIIIKNVPTKKNLVILQKNRDEELLKVTPDSTSTADYLFENLPELRDSIFANTDDIIDTMDDIITEVLSEYGQDILKYYELEMMYSVLNPDKCDISDNDIRRYPSLFNENGVFIINPDLSPEAENVLTLFPRIP